MLQEPDLGTQFCILKQAAPTLHKEIIRDLVAFTFWAKKLVIFEKPIALYEVIMSAKSLKIHQVKKLSKAVIKKTIRQLASQGDSLIVLSSTLAILGEQDWLLMQTLDLVYRVIGCYNCLTDIPKSSLLILSPYK